MPRLPDRIAEELLPEAPGLRPTEEVADAQANPAQPGEDAAHPATP
jgi:hypothetical protein